MKPGSFIYGAALALALLSSPLVRAADPAMPPTAEYEVRRASEAIKIDGDLNEAAWKAAMPTPIFYVYPYKGAPSPGAEARRTSAKMLWDDERLYIAVTCTDLDIRATRTGRDDDIFGEDCIEFFIMEQHFAGRYKHFLEYQVNARGTLTDAYNVAPYEGIVSWNSPGWQCAVKVDGTINDSTDRDQGWTVEMSMPFFDWRAILYRTPEIARRYMGAEFKGAAPKAGDRWRANLYRLKYLEKRAEYQAWSVIDPVKQFHDLERFGTLVFSDQPAGAKPAAK